MQNEFEKEVRQKLEELRLQPSPPVWEEVEWQIRPERKRRPFFWLVLMAGVVAGGIGLYSGVVGKNDSALPTVSQHAATKAQGTNQQKPGVRKQASPPVTDSVEVLEPVAKNKPSLAGKLASVSVPKKTGSQLPVAQVGIEQLPVATSSFTTPERFNTNDLKPVEAAVNQRQTPNEIAKLLASARVNIYLSTLLAQEQLDSLTTAIASAKVQTDSLQKTATDSITKVVRGNNKAWRKLVAVNAGFSSYTTGLFGGLFGAEKAIRTDASGPVFSSPVTGSGPNTATPVPAYAARPGFSFSVLSALVKPISRRTELSIGLAYSHYTTRQPIGAAVAADTVVIYQNNRVALNRFFTTGDTTSFTNRYGIISLPIGLHWQVHQRWPLVASFSAAYGRVVAANALAYSSGTNVFFKEDDYQKNFLPITIGLAYRFRLSEAQALSVGPVAMYNLLRLNKATETAQHLSFIGLQTSLRF